MADRCRHGRSINVERYMYFSFARKSQRLNIKRGTYTRMGVHISRGLQSISEYKGMLTTFAFYEAPNMLVEPRRVYHRWSFRNGPSKQYAQISFPRFHR